MVDFKEHARMSEELKDKKKLMKFEVYQEYEAIISYTFIVEAESVEEMREMVDCGLDPTGVSPEVRHIEDMTYESFCELEDE